MDRPLQLIGKIRKSERMTHFPDKEEVRVSCRRVPNPQTEMVAAGTQSPPRQARLDSRRRR